MEKTIGNIFAIGIVLLVIFSMLASVFSLLFRDGRGVSMYGNRGDSYMYNDY